MVLLDEKWCREIHGIDSGRYRNNFTFCGAYEELYLEISSNWPAEKTRKGNNQIYNNIILPAIREHDERCIWELTREDYEDAIASIKEKGYYEKGIRRNYSESTLSTFRRLIYYVVLNAAAEGFCDNVLWGTPFSESDTDSPRDDVIKEKVKLKKSLTVEQEKRLYEALTGDIHADGAAVGLLLMFALGLRNAEACGLNYGDIKELRGHAGCYVAWIYKSTKTGTNELQAGGKTINAGRIIPVPPGLYDFLFRRKMAIYRKLRTHPDPGFNIEQLPICCNGTVDDHVEKLFRRCDAKRISSIAHGYYKKAGITSEQIAFIDAELSDKRIATILLEKDAKAYLLRRNFATHLHILGLTTAEIQYLIGHDVEDAYESRSEFVDEERIYDMYQKLLQRPLFNNIIPDAPRQIRIKPNTVCSVRITAEEPSEPVVVRLLCDSQNVGNVMTQVFTDGQQKKASRQVNILNQYHKAYSE